MMAHRETRIIAAVDCPTCGATKNRPCRIDRGRPMVCRARKEAWQQSDRTPEFVLTPHAEGPPGARTHYMLVCPQTPETRDWLAVMTQYPRIGGAARVPDADMPELTRRILQAGWRTAETI